jgi:hypothetical protein
MSFDELKKYGSMEKAFEVGKIKSRAEAEKDCYEYDDCRKCPKYVSEDCFETLIGEKKWNNHM